MKALSLWQPWASAIACGVKCIETRSWYTPYRGPLAIHAAKKWDGDLKDTTLFLCGLHPVFGDRLKATGTPMPLGQVICTVDLVACTSSEELLRRGISKMEQDFGDFSDCRWGWEMANVKVLPEPIPARGFQQLWEWNQTA